MIEIKSFKVSQKQYWSPHFNKAKSFTLLRFGNFFFNNRKKCSVPLLEITSFCCIVECFICLHWLLELKTITCQYFVIYTLHIYDKHRCIPRQQKLGKKTFYSNSLSLFAKSRFPSSPKWNLDSPPSINTLSRIYIFINSYNMVPVHRFKHQYVTFLRRWPVFIVNSARTNRRCYQIFVLPPYNNLTDMSSVRIHEV